MVRFVLQYRLQQVFFTFRMSYGFTAHEQVKLHIGHKKGTASTH